MKTATKIKDLPAPWRQAALYKLSKPVPWGECLWNDDADTTTTEYVVSSAVYAMFSGPETLVFPATDDGTVIEFMEVGGTRGYMNTDRAIREMGYEVSA